MDTPTADSADSAEQRAARAVSAFLDAYQQDPQVQPRQFSPSDETAARAFRYALEGLGFIEETAAGIDVQDSFSQAAVGLSRDSQPLVSGYKIEDLFEQSRFGTTYRAVRLADHQSVVLTLLSVPTNRLQGELFSDLLRRIQKIGHSCVAATLDVGQTKDDRIYIASEYVPGRLMDLYLRQNPLSRTQAVELVLDLAEAINAAHLCGVTHRDLHPGNILISKSEKPLVLHTGLALMMNFLGGVFPGRQEVSADQEVYFCGESKSVGLHADDIQFDVYSLGALLYLALTGQPPPDHQGSGPEADGLVWPADRRWPAELRSIVRRATASDPEERYPHAAALAEDLRRFLRNEPVLAHPDSSAYRFRLAISRHRYILVWLGIVVLGLMLGAFWLGYEISRMS